MRQSHRADYHNFTMKLTFYFFDKNRILCLTDTLRVTESARRMSGPAYVPGLGLSGHRARSVAYVVGSESLGRWTRHLRCQCPGTGSRPRQPGQLTPPVSVRRPPAGTRRPGRALARAGGPAGGEPPSRPPCPPGDYHDRDNSPVSASWQPGLSSESRGRPAPGGCRRPPVRPAGTGPGPSDPGRRRRATWRGTDGRAKFPLAGHWASLSR